MSFSPLLVLPEAASVFSSSRAPHVSVAESGDAGYAALAQHIAQIFLARYGARVHVDYPTLLGLCDPETRLPHAGLGVRSASGDLFLERYLDRSVEQEILHHTGRFVPRARIAEAGNLASSGTRGALQLLYALSLYLEVSGYRYILFTATQGLKQYLFHLGLEPRALAPAHVARLSEEERARWGSYYDTNPMVMMGSVEDFVGGFSRYFARRASR